jgi:sphingomyelin phosphodiesterase acid-like 3
MVRSALAFALICALLLVVPVRAASPPQTWLVLSDIHFDPFTQGRLVDRLAAAPPARWREVFASGEKVGPSGSSSDTNFTLLESTLEGARNAANDPRVVIIAGDFLAHDFRGKFNRTARSHDDNAYHAFVDKTMGFLAWEIQTAFPRAQLLPVIGNNDGYCGDYESTPRDAFLAHTAADWAASVGAASAQSFIGQFSTGGDYSVPLPVAHAQAIVLNDVFWSPLYNNACGNAHDDPGGDEVTWLQGTQHALLATTPVWIIAHLPPGIDVTSTTRAAAARALPIPLAVPFLAPRFNGAYIAAIDAGFAVTAIAGHTHMDSFRIIGPDPSTPKVPMLIVPSVSPVYGNAPSFALLSVDEQNAEVDDSQVFILTKLHDEWTWHREYDFDSIYGRGPIDAQHLWNAQQAIFGDERVRRRYEQFYQPGDGAAPITEGTWRSYWCADVALTPTQYTACAMPQVQPDTETHPTPPPTPTPSPTPTASPSASPSP